MDFCSSKKNISKEKRNKLNLRITYAINRKSIKVSELLLVSHIQAVPGDVSLHE